jgi:hypothetical protein
MKLKSKNAKSKDTAYPYEKSNSDSEVTTATKQSHEE